MESIYKKVIVNEKDDVPADGEYDTNLGTIEVFCGKWVADELPEWYLEEVELPSEEELIATWKEKYETAIKQKINYSKEVDRLKEKCGEIGITKEYKSA
jgi:hypothetical protein